MGKKSDQRRQKKAKKRRERIVKAKHQERSFAMGGRGGSSPPAVGLGDEEEGGVIGETTYTGEVEDGEAWVEVEEYLGGGGEGVHHLPEWPTLYADAIGWGPDAPREQRLELARQVLADCLGEEFLDLRDLHERFAEETFSRVPTRDPWRTTSSDIEAWMESQRSLAD